jgi:lipopolysaccharide cholinephosphotransferase
MACTLQELQNTEYEILCKFADFCDAHRIAYGLSGGTLLGAIRHDGFIPWDDDCDVHMSAQDFKKFRRCIRRDPIPGMHFSWIDTDPDCPFYFAKLRKNGTYMPEDLTRTLDMHNGVWIDIFVYTGLPKSRPAAKLQQKLYFIFATTARLYTNNAIDCDDAQYNAKYRFLQGLSRKSMRRLRRLLFALYTSLGSSRSEYITYTDWATQPKKPLPRSFEMPTVKHVFGDREFSIPKNYDIALSTQYGDYMTPVEYPSHTDFSKVQL